MVESLGSNLHTNQPSHSGTILERLDDATLALHIMGAAYCSISEEVDFGRPLRGVEERCLRPEVKKKRKDFRAKNSSDPLDPDWYLPLMAVCYAETRSQIAVTLSILFSCELVKYGSSQGLLGD